MPPKRKAEDSPSTRATASATPSKVQRTYGRQPPAESPEAEITTPASKNPVCLSRGELDFTTLPSTTPSRKHKRRTDTQETPLTRNSKRFKVEQGNESAPFESHPRVKRTPRVKPVVEIPPLPRTHQLASPPPSHQSSSLPEPPPSILATPKKQRGPSHLPLSPSRNHTLLSLRHLPTQFHSCLNAQKRAILGTLHKTQELFVADDEEGRDKSTRRQLQHLLNGTLTRSEGNSCLLLGPRGSGKSKILDQCLKSLPEQPITIRLSGWIHCTDRLAMREIAYQLGRQTGKSFLQTEETEHDGSVEQDDNPFLDHPEVDAVETGLTLPPPSHLPALISVIPTLSRPTIVILDAFDLFALHPRQALLYCLLDTVQSCRASMENKGLAVVGLTARIDTINLLEKRVKSRFSGRVIRTAGAPTTKNWLLLAEKVLSSDISPMTTDADAVREWSRTWRKRVSDLLDDKNVVEAIKETVGLTKDPKLLFQVLVHMVTRLSPNSPFPSSFLLSQAVLSQRSRPPLYDCLDMPYPSLCLLISSVHILASGHDVFTFEMLFSTFRSQLRASSAAPVQVNGGSIGMVRCSKAILLNAFEHLATCHIFVPAASFSNTVAKEFARYRTTLGREEVKRLIEKTGQVNLKKWLGKAE